jgi:predicted phage-related endonuclease
MLRSAKHPWATATPDGWVDQLEDGTVINDPWPLEIKTTSAFRADDWVDGPPDHYMAQVQHQMLVTDARKATIACLLGGQRLVWCDVDRDEVWQRKIIHYGERFWRRVQDHDPPLPDGSDSSRRVLSKLFPADDGSVIELPAALTDVVDQWQALKSQAKSIETEIKLRENQIKAAIGDAQRGVFHGGGTVSWKTQFKQAYSVKASTSRVLRWHPPED